MTGLVTVIIPAYNRVKYITQAVESVLNQTYPNIELIVVDDGSSDGTYELLCEYGDKITLLTHQNRVNKGQSAAINVGLGRASGDYIAVLDSDDYWELNKLEIQVKYLKNKSEVGLVYSNGYLVEENGNIMYAYHRPDHQEHNDPNHVLLDCYLALPVNSLVRKSLYDKVGGFNENYRASQDHDMLIRIAEQALLAYLPDFLFYYRRHPQSISVQNTEARWRTGFKILQAAKARYPYKAATLRKRKALLYYRLAQSLARRAPIKALSCLFLAGLLDPVRSVRVITGLEKTK